MRTAIEEPPREQSELELVIGRKFAGALRQFHGVELGPIEKGANPPDLVSSMPCGEGVHLELTDAVDVFRAVHDQRRREYRNWIIQNCSTIDRLQGCEVVVVDRGREPGLPPPRSASGKACLLELGLRFDELSEEIQTLAAGKRRTRRWVLGPDRTEILIDCTRRYGPESQIPPRLHWAGGRTYSDGKPPQIIYMAVKRKLELRYPKSTCRFMLLVHSQDSVGDENTDDIASARQLLARDAHPFDEAWFLMPYQNRDLGILVRLFPCQ